METPKTLRELKDFLNKVDEKHLDRPFSLGQEHEDHSINTMDLAPFDMYYDPEEMEFGCQSKQDWQNYHGRGLKGLEIGIPKGAPIFTESV